MEIDIKPGEYKLIYADGREELCEAKPFIGNIQRQIGASCLDSVMLSANPTIVMLVDDTGYIDRKPVNQKATSLYHSVCRPGTVHPICGDVAIVRDEDFA